MQGITKPRIIIIKHDNKSPSAASVGTFRIYPQPAPLVLGLPTFQEK